MKFKIFSLLLGFVCVMVLPFFNCTVCAEKASEHSVIKENTGVQGCEGGYEGECSNRENIKSLKKETSCGAKETAKGLKMILDGMKKIIKPIKTQLIVGAISTISIPIFGLLVFACGEFGAQSWITNSFGAAMAASCMVSAGCFVSGVASLIK